MSEAKGTSNMGWQSGWLRKGDTGWSYLRSSGIEVQTEVLYKHHSGSGVILFHVDAGPEPLDRERWGWSPGGDIQDPPRRHLKVTGGICVPTNQHLLPGGLKRGDSHFCLTLRPKTPLSLAPSTCASMPDPRTFAFHCTGAGIREKTIKLVYMLAY